MFLLLPKTKQTVKMIQILLAPIKRSAVQLSGVDDVNSEHL